MSFDNLTIAGITVLGLVIYWLVRNCNGFGCSTNGTENHDKHS